MSSAEQIPPSNKPPRGVPARPDQPQPRWLSVEQIRKQQRCRRSAVIAAMEAGELPYERRGRIYVVVDTEVTIDDEPLWSSSVVFTPAATL